MSAIGIPPIPIWPQYKKEDLLHAGRSISADARLGQEWRNRKDELLAFRRYRDDWDGFGADAPDPAVVDVAVSYLDKLKREYFAFPPHRVALSPDGMVAIEWHLSGDFLRAEVVSIEQVTWMLAQSGLETSFWDADPLEMRRAHTRLIESREIVWEPNEQTVAGGAVFASVR
jgi:hypothetical protein